MPSQTFGIDRSRFQQQFNAFKRFVEDQSGVAFVSLASHPYTFKQEGYKYNIYQVGRAVLGFQTWQAADIGTGAILGAVIQAIEFPENNLVAWQAKYGEAARPHQCLYEVKDNPEALSRAEERLFNLYCASEDEYAFADLVDLFGKKYPLMAYLFFLKDNSRYLPIRPTYADSAFQLLGVELKTSGRCSWENYTDYLGLIGQVQGLLAESLSDKVTLLDAHSFTWILAAQMEKSPVVVAGEEAEE